MSYFNIFISITQNDFYSVCTFVLIKVIKVFFVKHIEATESIAFQLQAYVIVHKLKAFPHLTFPVFPRKNGKFSSTTIFAQ